jgi:hypothetical protein
VVSDLFVSLVVKKPVYNISIPVLRDAIWPITPPEGDRMAASAAAAMVLFHWGKVALVAAIVSLWRGEHRAAALVVGAIC